MQTIYGVHPVLETLKRDESIVEKIILARGKRNRGIQGILNLAEEKSIPVDIRSRDYLDELVPHKNHQGIACICEGFHYVSLDEMLARCGESCNDTTILILDCIEDPQNLGSLIRSAYCFGTGGIIIPEDRAAAVTPAVIRASAGAAQHVPVAQVVNIARALDFLKEAGFWIYGADMNAEKALDAYRFAGPVGVVMGSEKKGIRPLVRKKCDFLMSIPMAGGLDSLNVSIAGGIVLYEMFRQRRTSSKGTAKGS